jgi:acetolactate synthase I/II/III large subunit
LKQLLPLVDRLDTTKWLADIQKLKERFPLTFPKGGKLKAQKVIQKAFEISEGKAIVTTDVGQHQMWAAQYFKTDEPDKWLSSGGAGTMGFGFPAAIGAQLARPQELVLAIVGDGGFQMTFSELSTAFIHHLPVKILLIDNKFLGMVRQWQEFFLEKRYVATDPIVNPDFCLLAQAYGIKAFKIQKNNKVEKILKEAFLYPGPCLIHAEVDREDNVYPMIPAGLSIEEMIMEEPKGLLEMPEGTT